MKAGPVGPAGIRIDAGPWSATVRHPCRSHPATPSLMRSAKCPAGQPRVEPRRQPHLDAPRLPPRQPDRLKYAAAEAERPSDRPTRCRASRRPGNPPHRQGKRGMNCVCPIAPAPASRHLARRRVRHWPGSAAPRSTAPRKNAPQPPVIGQRRQRRDHRHRTPPCAILALQPPDRRHDLRFHAKPARQSRPDSALLLHRRPPRRHPRLRCSDGQIILGGAGEFGLVSGRVRSHRAGIPHRGTQPTSSSRGCLPPPRAGGRPHPGVESRFGTAGNCASATAPPRTAASATCKGQSRQPESKFPPCHPHRPLRLLVILY